MFKVVCLAPVGGAFSGSWYGEWVSAFWLNDDVGFISEKVK
jgi:hypothetical protein